MSFYKYLLSIMTFTILHSKDTTSVGNKELFIQKKGVEIVNPCAVGLVLFADVNNTSNEVDFEVEVSPDECCVEIGSEQDCDAVEIVGDCVEAIPKGTTKTLKFVAPILDPLERNGYCVLYLDSKHKNRKRGTMRDTIKIPFDTRLKNPKQVIDVPGNITACKGIDEDPLNDCNPVDCETYYNGRRSYFDFKTKRCTIVPPCIPNSMEEEVPGVIYDSTKNKCMKGKSVTNADIDFIKDLTRENHRQPKDILILKNLNKAPTPSYVFSDLKNVTNKVSQVANTNYMIKLDKLNVKDLKEAGRKFLLTKYFVANKCTVLVLGVIILAQCCLICLITYTNKKCTGCKKKKVIRKFFNYRQDASVTTPLICTSNIDTETTEFQYLSESSNIDKKIKCYKACQKERKNNVKMSMSDDILSKCITRRDWNSKPARSEAIPEMSLTEDHKVTRTNETLNSNIYQSNKSNASRKVSNVKVNFENEKPKSKKDKKQNKIVKSIVKKTESKRDIKERSYDEMLCELSEKEIKCHSYNIGEGNSKMTGFKPSSHSKKFSLFRTDKSKKGTVSISTEKGAQASFSNDSLDDFLSERGLIFQAGEDLSKYSFSSRSNAAKPSSLSSEVSSKTSKNNNMVKNVLSLLHRRSKHGPSSDPGAKKDSTIDLELIHMSHASVYSSNNESDYLKSLKITKDSRSSL